MRLRLILSETWASLRHNGIMVVASMLVTFISCLFIGAPELTQVQVEEAKNDRY